MHVIRNRKPRQLPTRYLLLICTSLVTGCVNANDVAKQIGQPPAAALKLRAMETRRFDTKNDEKLLIAASQTMQDLGFIISESSLEGGLVTGSKQRDATEAGQIVGQIALTVLLAALGSYHAPVWDVDQTIQATIVAYPIEQAQQTDVRVSFDRIVVDTNRTRRPELIIDGNIYQEFFNKFSNAIAIEAQPL